MEQRKKRCCCCCCCSKGITGPQGSSSGNGPQGPQGISATGAQGPPGVTGPTGASDLGFTAGANNPQPVSNQITFGAGDGYFQQTTLAGSQKFISYTGMVEGISTGLASPFDVFVNIPLPLDAVSGAGLLPGVVTLSDFGGFGPAQTPIPGYLEYDSNNDVLATFYQVTGSTSAWSLSWNFLYRPA